MQINLLSPAELDYLHSSLSLSPPIRPDGRSPTQFRPLIAETDLLPGTYGSARICFADGTEAIAGVKAEVEKAAGAPSSLNGASAASRKKRRQGEKAWVETSLEVPGYRDDDALPVFLAAMLNEALLATGDLEGKLEINDRFHWRLYIDILLLSPPTSYPIPLLSLTTHLALLSAKLPRLVSEEQDDPLFDDDWDAAVPLYPTMTSASKVKAKAPSSSQPSTVALPPITLLVASVGSSPPKIFFDPSREEITVADALLAVSLGSSTILHADGQALPSRSFSLLSVRTIDAPAQMTTMGVKDSENPATIGTSGSVDAKDVGGTEATLKVAGGEKVEGVWRPRRGGMPRTLVSKVIGLCVAEGGPAGEVLAGLEGFVGGSGS